MRYNHFKIMAAALAMQLASPNEHFMTGTPRQSNKDLVIARALEEGHKRNAAHKEHEFIIKGHKIMAYSKKDAITRLCHKGII